MSAITIELCAEDRGRLDRLSSLLEAQITLMQFIINHGVGGSAQSSPAAVTAEPAPVPEEPPVAPSITMAQIQKKAAEVAAVSAEKRAAVRDVVNKYAVRVSDLPEHAWDEVWAALCKLGSEV